MSHFKKRNEIRYWSLSHPVKEALVERVILTKENVKRRRYDARECDESSHLTITVLF